MSTSLPDPSPTNPPTIREVARACGVSPTIVSDALRSRGRMSVATRTRVLSMAREMGYRPGAVDLRAEGKTTRTLGFLNIEGLSIDGYHGQILNALLATTRQLDHNLLVFAESLWRRDPYECIRTYCDGRCDGLILISLFADDPLLPALRDRAVPFIIIGTDDLPAEDLYADVDNVASAHAAVEHLLSYGHQRIGMVDGPRFVPAACERHQGWQEALEEAGIAVREEWATGLLTREEAWQDWHPLAEARVAAMMARPATERPTALFVWNDGTVPPVLRAIQAAGLRVPEDISIMGFDDLDAAEMQPPLTTVRQAYEQIGQVAVETLLAQIAGRELTEKHVRLPGQIIERASVGPPPVS